MKKYLFLITSFLTALVASGATYYVVPGGAGNKNGTSWANAYADVQTAIDSASSAGGGEVWIAKGTYKHGSEMTMKNNVAICGGFAGTETSKDQRVAGNNTILDGEGKYIVFYNNYTYSNPLTNSAKLDNVTIQNGYASDGNDDGYLSTADYGAGMYNYYASPEITNCTFSNNSASSFGGGMYNDFSSSPKLTNCTFTNNSADYVGGGMYNDNSSSPVLTNCTFTNNSADAGGGGMCNSSSSPVLTNCTFSGNSAKDSGGGGMRNSSSSPTLTNCTFSNNSANYGGGMYNYKYYGTSSPVLTNCTFSGNSAKDSGGGMYNSEGSPTLTNCTFSGNSASGWSYGYGGGMYNDSSSPVLTNCTFSGNSASGWSYGYGGGVYNSSSSSPVLTNCTFSSNSASSYGGGMYNNSSSSPKLTNCILWGNTASYSGNEIYNSGSNNKPTIDTCIIKGGRSGIYNNIYGTYTNIITSDPKLMPLGNYGGSVQTCPVGAGSYAIGAGKVVEGVTTDARGFVRSTTPTIGACEYQNKLTVGKITTTEGYLKYSSSYEFTLNALSEGTNLTYQWYKDGVVIDGATSSSYKTSQSVGTSKYTVEISDGTTTITSSEIAIETIDICYYVSTIGSSSNDGLSWATAKSDVQDAIDLASSHNAYGMEVWIAKGTYKHGSAMTMKNNVAIYGGFAGTETSKDQRVSGNNTILDGEGKYRVFYNNYRLSNPLTNSAKLDNVTIQNGYVDSNNGYCGAGMCNYSASPEITNCTFSNNSARYGGGMYNSEGSPTLTNCTFSGNSASSYGGGMCNDDYSSPVLTNCTFSNNSASSRGGAMYNYSPTSPTLTNCILWGNTANYGNEIYNSGSDSKPTIDTCIIKGGKSGIYNSAYDTYTNIITADPKLMPLGNYGGNVQTCPVGTGSSAIGAGKVVDDVTTDARGVVRSTTAPTIGAYEYIKVKTPFESWAENASLTGDNALPTATPHNDGITNLEKFTFGLDASKATSYDANANFKHSTDASGNASLQFPVSVDAEGVVQVKALKSVDLINWTESTVTATGETSSDGKFKIYKATAPIGEEGKVFLKLKVEEK